MSIKSKNSQKKTKNKNKIKKTKKNKKMDISTAFVISFILLSSYYCCVIIT
jgi:hypothetical protein